MARKKSLITLLDNFRAECRLSTNPAQNAQVRDSQVNLLQRVQEWLWEDFDWTHLRVDRQIPVQAGQRFYDPPADIPLDRIQSIAVRYGDIWTTLCPEITDTNYIVYDSDLDQRGWPVQRWKIHENEMVELWPIPDSNGDPVSTEGMLRFRGIRNLSPLVNDDDLCDLDARLIVLYAAAEFLAGAKAPDAQVKKTTADRLYSKLRGNLMPDKTFKMFGRSEKRTRLLKGMPTVYYRTVI
jgi:hypothetical protein